MRFFILILITISLNACNRNLPDNSSGCKQKGLEDKFKEVYLYQIVTPAPSYYSYIKYGFSNKVKFDVTNIVETQISENRNVRSCEATLGIKLPIPVSKKFQTISGYSLWHWQAAFILPILKEVFKR